MSLSVGEKIGAVLAFIPFVSTGSGLIMAIVYYNRTKELKDKEQMSVTAQSAHNVAFQKFASAEKNCTNKLWKASLVEMIPGVNVIAATYSAFVLNELSEARDQTPEGIFEKHNLKLFPRSDKNELMSSIISLIDEGDPLANKYIHFCYGFIQGLQDKLPSAQELLEVAKKDSEESKLSRQRKENR